MGYRKKKKNGFFTRQGRRLETVAEKFTSARERSAARSDRRQTATLSRLKAKAEREKLRADIRKERTKHRPKPSQAGRKRLTVGLNGSQTGSSLYSPASLYSGEFGTGSASVGGFGRPLSKPKKRRTKKKKPAKRKKTTTKKRKKVYYEYR